MAGLEAYFLAIPDLHRYFMAQPNPAFAVKEYVIAMSEKRARIFSLERARRKRNSHCL